jgi:signal transduction histidine kinase
MSARSTVSEGRTSAEDLLLLGQDVPSGVLADARDVVRAVEEALTRTRASRQVPALLRFVLLKIRELLEVVWAAAWVFDEEQDAWTIAASLGLTPEAASVRFRSGSALPCQVGERGTPLLVNDLDECEFHRSTEEHYRMRSALYTPVKVGTRTVGVFAVYSNRRNCYTDQDLGLLTAVGEHLGMIVASASIEDRARQIAVLEERDRHARDLHDGVHQALSSLRIYTLEARDAIEAGDAANAVSLLGECASVIDEVSDELQVAIATLRQRHELFNDVYVGAARMRRRLLAAGVEVDMRFDDLPLAPAISDTLAWICREATTNILKHSNARHAVLELRREGGDVILTVNDDGVGILPRWRADKTALHIGLDIMRERAEEAGGELRISSDQDAGAEVQCRVPILPRERTTG